MILWVRKIISAYIFYFYFYCILVYFHLYITFQSLMRYIHRLSYLEHSHHPFGSCTPNQGGHRSTNDQMKSNFSLYEKPPQQRPSYSNVKISLKPKPKCIFLCLDSNTSKSTSHQIVLKTSMTPPLITNEGEGEGRKHQYEQPPPSLKMKKDPTS